MKSLLLSICLAFTAFADDTNRTFYVRVLVGGVETNSMASYVKRELRGLNDVSITDTDYRTTLSIVVVPLEETKTKEIRGYVASWAVTVRDGDRDILRNHAAQVGNNLRELAEKIATSFDTKCLEPSRQSKEEIPAQKLKQ